MGLCWASLDGASLRRSFVQREARRLRCQSAGLLTNRVLPERCRDARGLTDNYALDIENQVGPPGGESGQGGKWRRQGKQQHERAPDST